MFIIITTVTETLHWYISINNSSTVDFRSTVGEPSVLTYLFSERLRLKYNMTTGNILTFSTLGKFEDVGFIQVTKISYGELFAKLKFVNSSTEQVYHFKLLNNKKSIKE